MNVRAAVLVFIAIAAACGGKVVGEPDSTGSTGSTASSSTSGSSPVTNVSPTPTTTASTPQNDGFCDYNGSTASSGAGADGSYGCTSEGSYVCGHGASYAEIRCECASVDGGLPTGSCSCDDKTFAIDCLQGCSPTASVYASCNVRPR